MTRIRYTLPALAGAIALIAAGSLATTTAHATGDSVVTIQAAPLLSGISPGFGKAGDVVEITGSGFSSDGRAPKVTFLSLYEADIEEYSDSRIIVIVPVVPNPPDDGRPIELRVTTSAGSDAGPFRYYGGDSPGSLSEPAALTVKVKKGKVNLRWRPPESGASSVTSYQWTISVKGTDRWSKWATVKGGPRGLKKTVKRIKPRTDYLVEVRAMAGKTAGPVAQVEFRGK